MIPSSKIVFSFSQVEYSLPPASQTGKQFIRTSLNGDWGRTKRRSKVRIMKRTSYCLSAGNMRMAARWAGDCGGTGDDRKKLPPATCSTNTNHHNQWIIRKSLWMKIHYYTQVFPYKFHTREMFKKLSEFIFFPFDFSLNIVNNWGILLRVTSALFRHLIKDD